MDAREDRSAVGTDGGDGEGRRSLADSLEARDYSVALESAVTGRAPSGTGEGALGLDVLRADALGRLTGPFAHELRNALAGVRCYLELVSEVELPQAVAGFFREMEAGVERLTSLTTHWLDLASGRSATASPNAELHRLAAFLRSTGIERRLLLEEDYDSAVAMAATDPKRLQSVLFVLLAELAERAPRLLRLVTSGEDGVIRVRLSAASCEDRPRPGIDLGVLEEAVSAPLLVLEEPEPGYEILLPAAPPAEYPLPDPTAPDDDLQD